MTLDDKKSGCVCASGFAWAPNSDGSCISNEECKALGEGYIVDNFGSCTCGQTGYTLRDNRCVKDEATVNKSSKNTGMIIGIVVGVLLVLILVAVIVTIVLRRKKKGDQNNTSNKLRRAIESIEDNQGARIV